MDRLLAVLENNLSNNTYVAGNEYSIADIAVWPFVHGLSVMGLDLATLPALSRWINRIGSRPMVRRALAREDLKVPEKYKHQKQERSEEHTSELQSLMRNSYAVVCLKKTHQTTHYTITTNHH